MIPDYVTHYHLSDRQPFLSLSDLDGGIEHPIFAEMLNKHKRDSNYSRIYTRKYLDIRKRVETKLRALFEERGGKPKRVHPFYCILGDSNWFRFLNRDHEQIRIAIADLPEESTSLTFPDSFVAMSRKEKPYFEQVYFLSELESLVAAHGIPKDEVPVSYEKYWQGDLEKYIEVQIWDDAVSETYRKKSECQQFPGGDSLKATPQE